MSDPRVVTSADELTAEDSVVTVGFFDGVHRGHQALVERTVVEARERGLRAAAVTFDRHPMEVLRPGSQPRYLMSLDRRVRTLVEHGLDRVLVVPFTLEFSRESPEEFVDGLLVRRLQAVKVIVGGNFRFGHQAAGDVALLAELGSSRGFTVEPLSLLEVAGTPISSSEVRERLGRGDVAWVRQALGRPYWLDGTVARGEGRGRTIGIPTANVEVDSRMMIPATGVYAGWAEVEHEDLGPAGQQMCVTNVGTRPTFGGQTVTVETHLLDVDLELYGRHLSVGFTHRLRDERRFPGPDELVAQIRRDVEEGRRLLT